MDALKQLKEVSLSVLPISIISMIVGLAFRALDGVSLVAFLLSTLFVIAGLTLFLLGVDIGLKPIGNKIGAEVTRTRKLAVIIIVAMLLGFIITIAEPDIQVLSGQVHQVNPAIPTSTLIYSIALGVAIFLTISLLRTIVHLPLRAVVFIAYIIVFIIAAFMEEFFVSVAFDSGGATTGPLSVPFIMALGCGVASTQKRDEESEFGYVALSSIGPIIAVLMLGLVFGSNTSDALSESAGSVSALALLGEKFVSVGASLLPLLCFSLVAQLCFIKMPFHQSRKIFIGILYAYIGLVLFMFGVDFSFSSLARDLGCAIASASPPLLLAFGMVFGALVVLAEPAIWVLTEQVEEVSSGHIKRSVMMVTLSLGVALAVLLGLLRTLFQLSIWLFLIPGYALILTIMWKTPKLFSAIAFDSGGVATGPMSSAFILPFALGASSASEGASAFSASFGMIGLIAMMPVLSVELLGLIYEKKMAKARVKEEE